MFTVNFVDATHLLFTYNARSLMSRLPDEDPMDDDRNVAAVLLELPTGKVLARTEFRTHDHDKYLWPLSQGRFLLRLKSRLVVIEPNKQSDPFKEQTFADLKRRIGYIAVSPEGDLVTVETIPKRKPEARLTGAAASQAALNATIPGYKPPPPPPLEPDPDEDPLERRDPVQIHFYRVLPKPAENRVVVQAAGVVYSPSVINIPATAEGYLSAAKESASSWDFDFHNHTGKKVDLAVFDSSCAPRAIFITRSDFVAFGCRGADSQGLGGFNLRGEHNWITAFSDHSLPPTLVSAPAAGRFAYSRTIVSSNLLDPDNLVPELITAQEVTVLQAHDGRQLLKVQTSPVQRVGENYDLSPDGLELVTVRDGNLNLYRLPPLSGKDQAELKRATDVFPERNDVNILLGSSPVVTRKQARSGGVPLGGEVLPTAAPQPAPADAVTQPPVAKSSDAGIVGDQVPDTPRKAPSLYDKDHPKQ